MGLPTIDIASVPLLETAVGLFGSIAGESASSGPNLLEIVVTVVMIVYD